MSGSSEGHAKMMARALELAERGLYSAHPNPRVGCVLVSDGTIVGEGAHLRTGEAHAEIHALEDAGEAARGSTAYVTLEPCSHHGKTPPCAEAMLAAGVARVFVAMTDPNPKVAGSGIEILQNAGIDVQTGLMQAEAETLNEGFVSRMSRGRPFVRVKIAASLDGATAMNSGESRWITSEEARLDVQRLRARSGAVVTGVETVLEDDPSLTIRGEIAEVGQQPLRVVLDSMLRTPPGAKMFAQPGTTAIYCVDDGNRQGLERAGATIISIAADDGKPDLDKVLENLAQQGVNDVLVEAGPTLSGALLTAGQVDELVIYQAPHIMGSETRRMASTPSWLQLNQRLELEIIELDRIGPDLRIRARPAR